MTRNDFLRAMPPMPDAFVNRMERTLERKEQYLMKKRRTMRLAIALALVGALLIAGCALALTRGGLLEILFFEKEPPREAAELLNTVNESATSAGITVTMEEYIYDGENLALSYSLENGTEDTLFIYNRDSYLGLVADSSGNYVGGFTGWGTPPSPCALGGTVGGEKLKESLKCGLQAEVPAQSRGQELTLTVHADIYRPLVPLANSEQAAGDDGLWLDYGTVSWESPRMEAIYNAHYKLSFEKGVPGDLATALVEAGMLEKIGEVSMTQKLTPMNTDAARDRSVSLNAPIQMEAGDYLLTLADLRFTTVLARYTLTLRRKDGGSIRRDPAKDDWVYSGLLDGQGNDLGFGMGGKPRVAPDGVEEYLLQYDAVLPEMPEALIFCPQRADYFENQEGERFDLSRGVRLETANGVVLEPLSAHDRAVVLAPDFWADQPGSGRTLEVRARVWDNETLSDAFMGGEELPSNAFEPGYYQYADDTILIVEQPSGRLAFRSGKLPEVYWSLMMKLSNDKKNLGGSLANFSPEAALGALDQTLEALSLGRGRTLYMSAYDQETLRDACVQNFATSWQGWDEAENTPQNAEQWNSEARAEIDGVETPEGGYFIAVSLSCEGLPCVPEERYPSGISRNLPAGSGIAAFVNPHGVMYLETMDDAAIYEAAQPLGGELPLISIDEAKAAAGAYLSRGEAGETIELQCILYEHLPAWEGESEARLILTPVWSFYAARDDGALYPLVYVDGLSGKLRF